MTTRIPKYRLHRPTGLGVVRLNGKDFYLGKHGTPESMDRYDNLIKRWLRNGRVLVEEKRPADDHSPLGFDEIPLVELCLRYLSYCEDYYDNPESRQAGSLGRAKQMIRRIREIGGDMAATEFGPVKLEELQALLVKEKLARSYINNLTETARDMFRWGVTKELIPESTWRALTAVRNLRKGKTRAREPEPVMAVDDAVVNATIPRLPPVVVDMVRLQRLTGARPGEIVIMRPCDIERRGEIWFYTPSRHKTEHHGKSRVIAIGPKGQAILTSYLDREPDAYCFSPAESEKLRHIDMRRRRQSPVQPSQRGDARRAKDPKRPPAKRYTTASYRRAVRRASFTAGVEWWSPNRLRHSAATEIEELFTLEDSQAVLGHSNPNTTRRYSEAQKARAAEIMKKLG